MVLKKAISQRVLVTASLISLLLIVGSIYLHLQQKHHLGRMNISGGGKVTSTPPTVGHLPRDEPPPPPPHHGNDYLNDETHKTNSHEIRSKSSAKTNHKSLNGAYVTDNDSNSMEDLDVEYISPTSVEETHTNATAVDALGLTQHCLHCLCMTVNECKPFKCGHIDPCGIYGISKYYWLDGSSPKTTTNTENTYGEDNQERIDYLQCVNDERCAGETLRNYIKRYRRDCNGDGVIDCQDYITLHILGPSGCINNNLPALRKVRMRTCLK